MNVAQAACAPRATHLIVTGASKDLLENEVRPLIERFLRERGLELSLEKTCVTPIEQGFDFLGQNVRKPQAQHFPARGHERRGTRRRDGAWREAPTRECAFSTLKAFLRKAKARTQETLEAAIAAGLATITPENARGWFKHCDCPLPA